jgi:hypothetical protein
VRDSNLLAGGSIACDATRVFMERVVRLGLFLDLLPANLSYWTGDRFTQPDPRSTKNRVDVQLYRI